MTTVVILMLGFGAVLIISAIETDPTTGQSVSVLQTISDVWNNKVSFAQPSSSTSGGGTNTAPAPKTSGTSVNENWFAARADMTRYYLKHRGIG